MSETHYAGLLARFADGQALLRAARAAHAAGYRALEGYAPEPVSGLPAALGVPASRTPRLALLAALVAAASFFALQTWSAVWDYPFNIGGRPLFSWPAFLVVCIDMALLTAVLTTFAGLLVGGGLPRLYHPVFNVPQFTTDTQAYFLYIDAADTRFDPQATPDWLEAQGASEVHEVPA